MDDLVEVPENAVREEPLAFGLTAQQLLVAGIGVGIGLLVQALSLPIVLQVVLTLVLAGPVLAAAILPVRGEPAYRWVLWYLAYRRSPRTWPQAPEADAHKSDVSGDPQDGPGAPDGPPADRASLPIVGSAEPVDDARQSAPRARELPMTGDQIARLRVVDQADEPGGGPEAGGPAGDPLGRPAAVPHVLPTLRTVAVAGFAGGTGRTTIAAEIATYVAAHARIRLPDGQATAVRVLVLDAARVSSAVGLRLALAPGDLAAARSHRVWREPGSVRDLAASSRRGVDVVTLPPHPQLAERDGGDASAGAFTADVAGELLEGAQRAGYHLLVVDLGSVLEDGHRELIDQADLVIGVVRPTLESLPDVFRLATALRAQGMGRKLVLAGSIADDDAELRRLAREADVPVAGAVGPHPAFGEAADRGEPAWSLTPELARDVLPLARAAWPLLPDGAPGPAHRRSVLSLVRAAIAHPGAAR